MVYGTTLRLPGEFFDTGNAESMADPLDYVDRLQTMMRHLRTTSTRVPQRRRVHVDNALSTCTHVFLRHDAHRSPLQQPYDALTRSEKSYNLPRRKPYHLIASSQWHLPNQQSPSLHLHSPHPCNLVLNILPVLVDECTGQNDCDYIS